MSTGTLMTMEEFLALPDDGVERWLIRGQLREGDSEMTRRNPNHSRVVMRIGQILLNWLDEQPDPRGQVVGGEAGFELRNDPATGAGMDVAYVSAELVAATPDRASLFAGAPTLAVEVLSPSDRHEQIVEKVDEYLECGVPLVWVVDPDFETVTVHRPDADPEPLGRNAELDAEPHLPGFRVPVARLFE